MRLIERMMNGDSEVEPQMAAPLQIVYELLMRPKSEDAFPPAELKISESKMADALCLLQFAIEREIVARVVGISVGEQDEGLLFALDAACLHDKSEPAMH